MLVKKLPFLKKSEKKLNKKIYETSIDEAKVTLKDITNLTLKAKNDI